mgnify:FL=1
MKKERQDLSRSAEAYLLALFRFEYEGKKPGTSKLADYFEVKAPSVTGMLRRLHYRGWVRYVRYRPPELTSKGRELAVRLIRRHRILETFLVNTLGYTSENVHEEVESLEHTVSDGLLERIDAKLGHPAYDPHGEPIPDSDGNLPAKNLIPLTELKAGDRAILSRIDNRHRTLLESLREIGATPGRTIDRLPDPAVGKLVVRVGRHEMCLDAEVASRILVAPRRGNSMQPLFNLRKETTPPHAS